MRVRERFEKEKEKYREKYQKFLEKSYRLGLVVRAKICGKRHCWIRKTRLHHNIEEYRITPREGKLSSKFSLKNFGNVRMIF